jgi:hypothetical protein
MKRIDEFLSGYTKKRSSLLEIVERHDGSPIQPFPDSAGSLVQMCRKSLLTALLLPKTVSEYGRYLRPYSGMSLRWGVNGAMVSSSIDFQVLRPIVGSVAIDVVNHFAGRQRTSKLPLHNKSVLRDRESWGRTENDITVSNEAVFNRVDELPTMGTAQPCLSSRPTHSRSTFARSSLASSFISLWRRAFALLCHLYRHFSLQKRWVALSGQNFFPQFGHSASNSWLAIVFRSYVLHVRSQTKRGFKTIRVFCSEEKGCLCTYANPFQNFPLGERI